MHAKLNHTLQRSEALQAAIEELLDSIESVGSTRTALALASCSIATEHAFSLRVLIREGVGTSSIAVLRLQYEVVTRGVWLTWAASDMWITKLNAPLTVDTEHAAGSLPSLNEMLTALMMIEGVAAKSASEMLQQFKAAQWKSLNSFVHGGIHPLKRVREGYPIELLVEVVKSSNALSTMAAMLRASWTGNAMLVRGVSRLQFEFCDCLPALRAKGMTRQANGNADSI